MRHAKRAEEIVDLIDDLVHDNSKSIINKIDNWIESMDGNYLDSSSLGKVINYYLNRKNGLHLFLENEIFPIDNIMAERRPRCPVMVRKNFLHFKSINGADVGSYFYSFIESCKSNGLNARACINEMPHRSATYKELESPYNYAKRLTEEIKVKLAVEIA